MNRKSVRRPLVVLACYVFATVLVIGFVRASTTALTEYPTGPSLWPAGSSFKLYDDALATGWRLGSWGATVDVAATTYVYSGANAISYTITGRYGAFAPQLANGQFDLTSYSNLRFYVNGEATGGQKLGLLLRYAEDEQWTKMVAFDKYIVGQSVAADEWRLVDIPLSAFQLTSAKIDGVALQDASGGPQPAVSVDDIEFYGNGLEVVQQAPVTRQLTAVATRPGAPGPVAATLLLYFGTKSAADVGFEKITRFYGLSRWEIDLEDTVLTDGALRNSAGDYYATVYVDADNLDRALDSAEQAVLRQAIAAGGVNLLVSNLRIGNSSALEQLTGGEISGSRPVVDSSKDYLVSAQAPEITRQLSGLTITYPAPQLDHALVIAADSSRTQVLVHSTDDNGQSYPVFAVHQSELGRVFVVSNYTDMVLKWNNLAVNYLATADGVGFSQQWFAHTMPTMMFVRFSAGDKAWHNDNHYANFTLDDPDLRSSSFDYQAILEQALLHNFHFTLAFQPANLDKVEQLVVDLFLGNPGRLSLAQHGNNHDGYEFYRYQVSANDPYPARPLADQEADVLEGRARMRALSARTGVPYAPVMIFPFNISPTDTLALLKKYNYQATINSQDYPLDGKRVNNWDSYIYPAEMSFGNFAVIKRQNANAAAFPFDLFLDRPVFIYDHEGMFAKRGIGALNPIADRVNGLAGEVEWRSLESILKRLYLEKTNDDGSVDVMFFGNNIVFDNQQLRDVTYHLQRSETLNAPIQGVYLDGAPVEYAVGDGILQVDVVLPARSSGELRIVYGTEP